MRHILDFGRLVVFALAYLGILIVPGPGVTALVARVLAQGKQGVGRFIAGFVIGSLVWLTAATLGLAALLRYFPPATVIIRLSGCVYLMYLAWRLWNAPAPNQLPGRLTGHESTLRLISSGLYINLANPKAIVFFASVLPSVIRLDHLELVGFAALVLIVLVVASAVLAIYAFLAHKARGLLSSAKARLRVSRISAGVVAVVAITMLAG